MREYDPTVVYCNYCNKKQIFKRYEEYTCKDCQEALDDGYELKPLTLAEKLRRS